MDATSNLPCETVCGTNCCHLRQSHWGQMWLKLMHYVILKNIEFCIYMNHLHESPSYCGGRFWFQKLCCLGVCPWQDLPMQNCPGWWARLTAVGMTRIVEQLMVTPCQDWGYWGKAPEMSSFFNSVQFQFNLILFI